ncbi:MAG: ABC transporter permease [Gammaproteobacteria bacterium]
MRRPGSDLLVRAGVGAFVALFFVYLFGPLLIMGITAFNSSAFPRVSPWECFSVEWFSVLANDARLMQGLRNSVIIGLGVMLLAVPIGLAGALLLMQLGPRVRPWYYTTVVAPILVPGVVLGISTLIFWDRIRVMFGASTDSFFYDGIFLTIVGQSTFIAAYAMLVFIARLQRFDPALEEAALDLGATHVQAFRKVLLPFLKPAIGSAAVLAFLASFENYNTTVFTIVSESTLTTVLASKVRYGINPSISALAITIVIITLLGACVFEIVKRRQAAAEKASALAAARAETETTADSVTLPVSAPAHRHRLAYAFASPAMAILALVFVAGLGTTYFAGTVGVAECKQIAREERRKEIAARVAARRAEAAARAAAAAGDAFDPSNLRRQAGGAGEPEQSPSGESPTQPDEPVRSPGAATFGGVFDPTNLRGQGEGGGEPEEKGSED